MDKYVIDDPGSLGWDYDEDTGRWTWGGSGSNSDGGGFPEAPIDGKQYGRQDAGWTEVVKGGGSGGNDPRIADQDISNWNTSFSWGDHSGAGYLTAETDPTVPSHVKSITTSDIDNWNSGTGGGGGGNDARITDTQISNWDTAFNWGNHATQGYLTTVELSGYATESWVGVNFQAKGNYLVSTDLNGYATHLGKISASAWGNTFVCALSGKIKPRTSCACVCYGVAVNSDQTVAVHF